MLTLYIRRTWDVHANRRKRGKFLVVITHTQSITIAYGRYRNNSILRQYSLVIIDYH